MGTRSTTWTAGGWSAWTVAGTWTGQSPLLKVDGSRLKVDAPVNEDEFSELQRELHKILGSNWKTRPEMLMQYVAAEQEYQRRVQMMAAEDFPETAKHIYSNSTDQEKLQALAGLTLHPVVRLEHSQQELTHVHSSMECQPPCPIHHRTDHAMRLWPQNYRMDMKVMERLCSHGVGHPDPDERTPYIHGCDGCCAVVRSAEAIDITELVQCPHCEVRGTELQVNIHRMEAKHHGGANRT